MKLSACYIVKNAEAVLGKSLESLKGSVDEIVVVDTGSVDASIEIARQAGAKVYSYSWQDDFAAARNFALGKADGDWIVFLDADEYFTPETAGNLRSSIRERENNAELLFLKVVNIDEDRNNEVVDSYFAPKIFVHKPDFYYVGKIHEQLKNREEIITAWVAVPEEGLCLYHTGYSTSRIQQKAQRNLRMLLQELNTTDEPEKLYMHLAEAYDGVGDTTNAMYYARLDISGGRKDITYASRSYRILLRLLEQQSVPDTVEILQTLEKSIQDFPELPEFRAEYAQYLAETFDYDSAISQMQQALECYTTYSSIEPSTFDVQAKKLANALLEKWKQTEKLQQNLTLSACVITKNEAEEIGRWIENMRQFSDEQIIVDTGSEDRTVEIAESYGIKVYKYVWQDNFADAKNFAIEKAKGDWIAFLDADEYFSVDTVGSVRSVVAEAQASKNEPDAIMCPKVNIDVDKNNMELSRFMELRLFRNLPALRYHGNIHECIQNKKRNLEIYVEKKRIKMYHTGYSTKRVKEKLWRNLKLLQQDIAKNGEGPQHYRYLLDCYHLLGEHDKAVKYGKLHLASKASSIGMESQVYINLINSMGFLQTKEEEICKYIKEAIERFPNLPDFYACFAGSLLRQEKFKEAKKYLVKALDIYENDFFASTDSSNFSFMLTDVYSNLADIAYREEDYAQAKVYLDLSLQKNKYNRAAFKQVYGYIKGMDVEEQRQTLGTWYNQDKKDLLFLLAEIEQIEISELYFYYIEILKKSFGIFSAKSQFYQAVKGKTDGDSFSFAVGEGVKSLEFCVYAAVCLNEWDKCKEVESVLPISLFHCIQRYYDVLPRLSSDDLDGYKILLGILAKLHPQQADFWEPVIGMAKDFPTEEVPGFIELLFAQQVFYPIQFLVINPVANHTGSFFLQAGIALYHCQKYEAAKVYLQRIKENETYLKEAKSYMVWLEEKIKNKCE